MASPTVTELQQQLTAVTAERNTLLAALESYSIPIPGRRTADAGAEELAEHIYSRIPGLRLVTLGGPTLSAPVKVRYPDGSSMVMSLRTPDGKLYQVETYLQGT